MTDMNPMPNGTMADMPGMVGGMMDGMGEGMMMMSPWLFTRTTGFFILFRQANVTTNAGFLLAFGASFVFAALATLISLLARAGERRVLAGGRGGALFGALLFAVRSLLHYTAMLIVMTMQVYLILGVVVGHAVGWLVYALVFARGKKVDDGGKGAPVDSCDC